MIDLPPHAYVPGRTPRHAEGAFDAITDSVRPGMTPAELARTRAWAAGWRFIDAGFYWEAHEVLEPVWMQTAPDSAPRAMVAAVIQYANAELKRVMGRPKAALRLCDIAAAHLERAQAGGAPARMGVEPEALHGRIARLREALIPPDDAK